MFPLDESIKVLSIMTFFFVLLEIGKSSCMYLGEFENDGENVAKM